MRKVAGRLRLDLAQYRELEAFAAFGSDLDAASKAQLERGARLVELLKQPQYTPFPVEHEVVSIWAGTTGELDDVPVEDIRRFETEFLDYLRREHKGIFDGIRETKDLADDTVDGAQGRRRRVQEAVRDRGGRAARSTTSRSRRWTRTRSSQEKITKHRPPRPAEGASRWAPSYGSTAGGSAVESTKKITKAMELIAASRIVKAQQRVAAAAPYAEAITRARHGRRQQHRSVDHPLTVAEGAGGPQPGRPCCVVTSDRGLGRRLTAPTPCARPSGSSACCSARARTPCPSSSAARASAYYRFRNREIGGRVDRFSESPTYAERQGDRRRAASRRSSRRTDEGGVDEIHIVYTEFISMLTQDAVTPADPAAGGRGDRGGARRAAAAALRVRAVRRGRARRAAAALRREPHLHRAAPVGGLESAARRRAMKSATDNADELIKTFTRAGEPGPPGRDHPGNQRDRRRRRTRWLTPQRESE